MIRHLHTIRRWAGVDRAVFFAAGARAWSVIAGGVTLLLVGTTFTKEVQGFYYTFSSLMGLLVFLELGLGQSLVQFTSHEFAKLTMGEKGQLKGDSQALSRLRSLGRVSVQWYAGLAVLLLIFIGAGGHIFFAAKGLTDVTWKAPWWCFCVASALNVLLMPIWSLLEGCNQVARVNGCRLAAGIALSLTGWCSMKAGANLYTCALCVASSVVVSVVGLFSLYPWFIHEILKAPSEGLLEFFKEIWPFQWRISVSWICGYFIFSMFTPILFQFHGPVVAGQMGMTWQALSALGGLAGAWTQTKVPRYGMLISEQKYDELDSTFRRATIQTVGIALLGSLLMILGIAWLKAHHSIGHRFLDIPSVIIFCVGTIAGQFIGSLAFYLRAHKKEPLMVSSIVTAGVVGFGTWLMGKAWGGFGVALAYTLGMVVVTLPLTTYIFLLKRREWHSRPALQALC